MTAWAFSFATGPTPMIASGEQQLLLGRPISQAEARQRFAVGQRAEHEGNLALADQEYRLAWNAGLLRERAAQAMWRLHKRRDFEPAAPEEAIAVALDQVGAGFSRYETEHFVIITDSSQQAALEKGSLLERTRHQFYRVMRSLNASAAPLAAKQLCILFSDEQVYRAFAKRYDSVEAPWVAGYYASVSNRIVLYDDKASTSVTEAMATLDARADRANAQARQARRERRSDRDLASALAEDARRVSGAVATQRRELLTQVHDISTEKTIHEATHLLAFNSGVQSRLLEHPFWLTEGLATSFESPDARRAFGPDQPSPRRDEEAHALLAGGFPIPLRDLVAMTDVTNASPAQVDSLYAESFALFTYLHRHDRRQLGTYLNDLAAEPPGKMTPVRHLSLFEARFGDTGALERRIIRWLGDIKAPSRFIAEAAPPLVVGDSR